MIEHTLQVKPVAREVPGPEVEHIATLAMFRASQVEGLPCEAFCGARWHPSRDDHHDVHRVAALLRRCADEIDRLETTIRLDKQLVDGLLGAPGDLVPSRVPDVTYWNSEEAAGE